MTPHRLTVPEKLLLAALEVRKRAPIFTAEDLIVQAWTLYPDTFGLSGYSDKYPDSNRVLTKIMGTKGMRGKGWLRKVGEKLYRLTSAGLNDAANLMTNNAQVPAESTNYLRAELDRQTAAALDRLLSTTAAKKALAGQAESISFHEACGFWDITGRSNANTLTTRLAESFVILSRAKEAMVARGDSEGLKLGSCSVTVAQIDLLLESHAKMQEQFKTELDIIRRRKDERAEKRKSGV